MKVNYKGYVIMADKDESYPNNMNVLYSIYDKNGFRIIINLGKTSGTIKNYIKKIKQEVDEIIEENKIKKDRYNIIIKKIKLYVEECDDKDLKKLLKDIYDYDSESGTFEECIDDININDYKRVKNNED